MLRCCGRATKEDIHHPPAARGIVVSCWAESFWMELRGDTIAKLMNSGAVALLDAQWLVDFARSGSTLRPRQSLPYEAFVSVDQLKSAQIDAEYLRVVAVSHMWLTPLHPDPYGTTLQLLARVLSTFLAAGDSFTKLGVFFDYCSLLQHPDPENGIFRTAAEDDLFRQGLGGLASLYSHQYTFVFKVTTLPTGYPNGYALPAGAGVAAYDSRGWCFTESSWASMTKKGFLTLDLSHALEAHGEVVTEYSALLGRCAYQTRRPPPLPEQFEAELLSRSFTNGRTDRPLVTRLYSDTFCGELGRVTRLVYRAVHWDDDDAVQLAAIAALGAMRNVEVLDLNTNDVGERGAVAIAEAIQMLPKLTMLNLYDNPRIRPDGEGGRALRAAVEGKPIRLHLRSSDIPRGQLEKQVYEGVAAARTGGSTAGDVQAV